MIRLIATDLAGTLLRPDRTVSARTRAALDSARVAGLWGLERLCARLGVAQEVLAFGDAPNDAEMLGWARRGGGDRANAGRAALQIVARLTPPTRQSAYAGV